MTPSVDKHEDLWFHENNGPNLEQELFDDVSLLDDSSSRNHQNGSIMNVNNGSMYTFKKPRRLSRFVHLIQSKITIFIILCEKYILRFRNKLGSNPQKMMMIPPKKKIIMATILAAISIFFFFPQSLDSTNRSNIGLSSSMMMTRGASSSTAAATTQNSLLDQYPYNLLKNVDEIMDTSSDIPFFWHIHKAGGSTLKHIFSCLRQVQTRKVNKQDCSSEPGDPLQLCQLNFDSLSEKTTNVINVDASSLPGISRSMEMNLLNFYPHPFILTSSRVYDALPILTPQRKGRLFLLMRHPVERAISKFYYTKIATWENLPYQSVVANMTLAEYANSKYCQNNWMTRRLVNKMKGEEITWDDLEMAKLILRTKALILLLEDIENSVHRMREYFQWNIDDSEQNECLHNFLHTDPVNANNWKQQYNEPTKDEWLMLRAQNEFDVHLMAYAKILYKEQGEMLFESPPLHS